MNRGEVDGPHVVEHDPPRAVLGRERKRRSFRPLRVRARRAFGISADDVDVDHGTAEQLVAHRPTDEPCLLAAQNFASTQSAAGDQYA